MEQRYPDLLSRTIDRFRSGYGARAIGLSRDGATLFVGCKDGSITVVDLKRAIQGEAVTETRLRLSQPGARPPTGVRAIYDCGDGWLLIGDDQRSLSLVGWQESVRDQEHHLLTIDGLGESEEFSPVTLIEEWDIDEAGAEVIVSLRQGDTWIFRLEETDESAGAPFLSIEKKRFAVRAVCGLIRDGSSRLLISESGELWLVDGDGDAVDPLAVGFPDPWKRFEKPGLISDVALMPLRGGSGAGAYFSCDEGVFRIRFLRDEYFLEVEKELLPGLTGMSMAVSQIVQDEKVFLWVSDLIGDVHLFCRSMIFPWDRPVPWERLGFRLESSQVIRSIATYVRVDSTPALCICQACRSDRIVLTWYTTESSNGGTQSADIDIAYLLSRGTWNELKSRVEEEDTRGLAKKERGEWGGPLRDQWTPEAVLADFFEEAGEYPGELAFFLANPSTSLAWSVLEAISQDGSGGRAAEAVLTWTYALIGTIHRRMADRREQQCLGVIRWLRRLSERCSDTGPKWHQVREATARAIQHVRKWGVFGSTYYERREIEGSLDVLREWHGDYRKFDHIVYSALLFGRRVNMEAEFPDHPRGPLTAWDVRYLPLRIEGGRPRDLIAVSWREGAELYERIPPTEGRPLTWKQVWPKPVQGTLDTLRQEPEAEEGFSRKILMGWAPRTDGRRPYILEAPAKAGGRESFQLWWIDPTPEGEVKAAAEGASEDLGERESVYSLLELSPGLVLAGMQVGKDQTDREGKERLPLVVVRTTPEGGFRLLRCADEAAQLPSAYPETRTIESQRNPVLALARDPNEETTEGRYTVIVGRGDGQVLRIRIRVPEDTSSFHLEDWTRVARLGAPVRTLVYQSARSDSSGDRPPRVFAGATDGTLVAFQEVGVPPGEEGTKEAFATLWATREEGPIARIHLCDCLDEDSFEVVLAVTQKGMAILFLNSSRVGGLKKDWGEHQRIKVPGERLGRFSLGTSVFGSALVDGPWSDEARSNDEPRPDGQVARLVVATGEGTLRVLTLHYPKYTEARRTMFKHIQEVWLSTLLDSQNRVKVSLLRKIESMHAAAPNLPSIFVRWILSSKPTQRCWKRRVEDLGATWTSEPAHQWIPRHLQALVDLDDAWSSGRSLKGRVRAALHEARKEHDLRLFKEIIEVTLRRANEELFLQALEGNESAFADRFKEIMHDLNEMKGVWLGASGETDTKVRIVFAKSLVDGDTLWSLASRLGEADKPLLWQDPQEITPFRRAMRARVEQLHRFLAAGDPLLALETLRAANLAVFRAVCRILIDPDPNAPRDLHWDSIQGYFEAVGDFAARVAHSGQRDMTDAVAHEICRAYAIGMLACPSHAFRLSSWMCEADLPQELALGVRLQLQLLEQLLNTQLPEKARELFESVVRKLQSPESGPSTLLIEDERAWGEPAGEDPGKDNRDMISEWALFDEILDWLRRLTDGLLSEASDIGLSQAWELWEKLDQLQKKANGREQITHSLNFWHQAIDALVNRLERKELRRRPRPGQAMERRLLTTRPDLVLFSHELKSWCAEQTKALQQRKNEFAIFDPQYSMYVRAFDLLAGAAAGFPQGAALQKNVVLGVLGHSLLELLDEHLLELWEIAQVLDPKQTWDQEDQGEENGEGHVPAGSRASEFARYLLSTARQAELIPKNLRNLQGLLSYPARDSQELRSLGELLQEFKDWELVDCIPDENLSARSYHFLRLTLGELAQNHQVHGLAGQKPSVSSEGGSKILIEFPYDKVHLARLASVVRSSDNLQRPVRPREEPHSQSHGAGLYLANLAAAAVGWKLAIEDPTRSPGRLRFLLGREHLR